MERILLIAVVVAVASALLVWRAHLRVIVEGAFRNFTIGMTKSEAFGAIQKTGINAVSAFQKNPMNSHSAEEFRSLDLNSVDGLGVHDFGLSFTVYFSDGKVTDVVSYEETVLGGSIQIGGSIDSVKEALLREYQKRENMWIIPLLLQNPKVLVGDDAEVV
jgi:hypothetical protein